MVAEATRPLPVVEGKGKEIATKEQAAQSLLALHNPKKRSTMNQFIFQRQTPTTEEASTGPSTQPQDDTSVNIVRDSPSPTDAETGADTDKTNSKGDTEILQIGEEQGDDVANMVNLEEKTAKIDEGQAGPDPGESRVALAGPNLEPTHDEFMDPLSSTGTLSPMKNLDDAFTIEDQFINDKSTEDELEKPMRKQKSKVFTLELQDLPHKINQTVNEVVKEVVHVALQAPFRDRFRELPEADMKEILHQRMFETSSYKSLPEHVALYEALEASMKQANRDKFLAEKDKSHKRRCDDEDPPPPPPDSDLIWKTSDTRETSSSSSRHKSASHSEQPVEDVPILDNVNVSDSKDTDTAHLPKIKTRPDWLKPIPEEDRPTTPEPDWVIPPNELPEPENNWANALASSYTDPAENKLLRKTGPTFKVAKAFHENNIFLQFQMEECHQMLTDQVDLVNPEGHRLVPDVRKPLPLGGPPGQLKAAQYLDFGLEELVPSLWIESEREYDISAAYGISHWWFKRKEFYVTRHSAPSDRSTIVLRRADYKEYKISKTDFKNLHPNDFEYLYMLHLQGQLNHLSGDDKVHLFNAVNLWIRNIVIRKRVEDLQLGIENRNEVNKMMRINEVHKFSDGTLTRVLNKLDHMVKDFKLFEYNRGMENMIWSEDDKRRSEEFIENIRVIPKYHNEDGNPARANIKQALGRFEMAEECAYDDDDKNVIQKIRKRVLRKMSMFQSIVRDSPSQIEELLEKLTVSLTVEELQFVKTIHHKAMKLQVDFLSAQPINQNTIVPLYQALGNDEHNVIICSGFDMTCSVVYSCALLADVAIIKSSKIVKENGNESIVDGSSVDNLRDVWSCLHGQHVKEYEQCIDSIMPSEKACVKHLRSYRILENEGSMRVGRPGVLKGLHMDDIKWTVIAVILNAMGNPHVGTYELSGHLIQLDRANNEYLRNEEVKMKGESTPMRVIPKKVDDITVRNNTAKMVDLDIISQQRHKEPLPKSLQDVQPSRRRLLQKKVKKIMSFQMYDHVKCKLMMENGQGDPYVANPSALTYQPFWGQNQSWVWVKVTHYGIWIDTSTDGKNHKVRLGKMERVLLLQRKVNRNREYDKFKVRINAPPESIRRRSNACNAREEILAKKKQEILAKKKLMENPGKVTDSVKVPKATWMSAGNTWHETWFSGEEDHTRGDHAGIIELMLAPPGQECTCKTEEFAVLNVVEKWNQRSKDMHVLYV
ncbi:retrovirus-related pol polyprotein from transposon TNT 1-94 [Tanacetum coccineum]